MVFASLVQWFLHLIIASLSLHSNFEVKYFLKKKTNFEVKFGIWIPSRQSSPVVYPAVVTTVGSIHGWERKSKIK